MRMRQCYVRPPPPPLLLLRCTQLNHNSPWGAVTDLWRNNFSAQGLNNSWLCSQENQTVANCV